MIITAGLASPRDRHGHTLSMLWNMEVGSGTDELSSEISLGQTEMPVINTLELK